MPTDAFTSRAFYITLGSGIEVTAYLAARLQLENGGLTYVPPSPHTRTHFKKRQAKRTTKKNSEACWLLHTGLAETRNTAYQNVHPLCERTVGDFVSRSAYSKPCD